MEQIWTDTNVLQMFYESNSFKKGGGPGGDFTGKVLRQMISEESLAELERLLGEEQGAVWIRYLAAIREIHKVLVKENLDDSYEDKVQEFQDSFNDCNEEWGLHETLKVHILAHHVSDFLALEGITCWSTNDELVESCHALLERRMLRHGLKNTKNLTGTFKRKESLMSLNISNAKNKRYKK